MTYCDWCTRGRPVSGATSRICWPHYTRLRRQLAARRARRRLGAALGLLGAAAIALLDASGHGPQ